MKGIDELCSSGHLKLHDDLQTGMGAKLREDERIPTFEWL